VKISFLPLDLARWDQAAPGDLLAVGFTSDVRPLRGAAGLLDWRFDGRLSALIVAGGLTGALDEPLLMPSNGRLPWRLTLAVGLGPSAELDEARAARAMRRILTTMRGLGLVRPALALPGREGDRLPAKRALQLFLEETEKTLPGVLDEVTLVETPAGQKELGDAVRKKGAPTRGREPRARGTA
jgi:Cytosol aminopeptidase family, N-terminal domain